MAIAALLSLALYVFAVRSQGDFPQWWFVIVLVAIVAGAAISSGIRQMRGRRVVLLASSVLAAIAGLISLTSTGGPLIATAALGLIAFLLTYSR